MTNQRISAKLKGMLRTLISILLTLFLLGCSAEAELPPEACSLAPDPGPCKARMEKFFFNDENKSCDVFFWGGCDGVVPFNTLSDCIQQCLPEQAQTEPSCEFEGTFYDVGDSWPVDCNTCTCDRSDPNTPPQIVCTEMACGNSTIGLENIDQEYPYTFTLIEGESKPIPGGSITFKEITKDNTNAKIFLEVEQGEGPPTTLFIDVTPAQNDQSDIYIYDLYLQLKQLHLQDDPHKIELLIDKNTEQEGASMKPIDTQLAPKAIGPYSQAMEHQGLLFISGQIPINPKTQTLELFEGDIQKQTSLVLSNIQAILDSQQLTRNDVIKTTIYITDMEKFSLVNDVYADFFKDHKPARATIGITALPKGALIEIEAIARTKGD